MKISFSEHNLILESETEAEYYQLSAIFRNEKQYAYALSKENDKGEKIRLFVSLP